MVRLLFCVGRDGSGYTGTYHTIDVDGPKAELLLRPGVQVLGIEDLGTGLSDRKVEVCPQGGFVIPEDVRAAIEKQITQEIRQARNSGDHVDVRAAIEKRMREHGNQTFPAKEVVPSTIFEDPQGGSIEQALESLSETIRDRGLDVVAETTGESRPEHVWLLRNKKTNRFVPSTTEEGGESYIACTSLPEALKVAEQQKIYDIDSVPVRVS